MQTHFPSQEGSPATLAHTWFDFGGERVPERCSVTRTKGCAALDPRPPGFATAVHPFSQFPGGGLDEFHEGDESSHFWVTDR